MTGCSESRGSKSRVAWWQQQHEGYKLRALRIACYISLLVAEVIAVAHGSPTDFSRERLSGFTTVRREHEDLLLRRLENSAPKLLWTLTIESEKVMLAMKTKLMVFQRWWCSF